MDWHNVKSSTPEPYTYVLCRLVVKGTNSVREGFVCGNGTWWCNENFRENGEVTHWAEMPVFPGDHEDSQELKRDSGKPRLALVPPKLIRAVGEVRTYGVKKYHSENGWDKVNPHRYKDALMRHLVAYLEDEKSVDKESGLPHLWHLACNVAFLIEMGWPNGKA